MKRLITSGLCSDNEIKDHIAEHIERESGGDLHIGPSSMDVHLYPQQVEIQGGVDGNVAPTTVDVSDESTHPERYKMYDRDPIRVQPGKFCLARTDEILDLPSSVMAVMHGRSSIGRLGLFVENAGLVDRGFEGSLTLELYNPTNNIIEVPAYQRVAQLVFYDQGGKPENAYDGKYQGQIDATESRAYEDQ